MATHEAAKLAGRVLHLYLRAKGQPATTINWDKLRALTGLDGATDPDLHEVIRGLPDGIEVRQLATGLELAVKRGTAMREQVVLVFDRWRTATGRTDETRLLPKRERLIEARLKEGFSVEQLCLAIDGCVASAFHQGQNERNQVYDDLTLILRDGTKVEYFMALARPRATVRRSPVSRQQVVNEALHRAFAGGR